MKDREKIQELAAALAKIIQATDVLNNCSEEDFQEVVVHVFKTGALEAPTLEACWANNLAGTLRIGSVDSFWGTEDVRKEFVEILLAELFPDSESVMFSAKEHEKEDHIPCPMGH